MRSFSKALFVLACGSLFLPWFTRNPELTGYFWGFRYVLLYALPLFALGVYLFEPSCRRGGIYSAIAELGAIAALVITAAVPGWWQQSSAFLAGGAYRSGIRAACAGYWVSLALFAMLFKLTTATVFSGKKA